MRRPSRLQKLLHGFFMLRPVSAFFATRVHKIDMAVLRVTGGRFAVSEILGWNVIQLTTIGAKTRQLRTLPLMAMFDGERIALVASSFGRRSNPGWYYNLKAHPECEVQRRGCLSKYIAHEAAGEAYERYWQLAISCYAGYDRYRQRAAHRHIPVMILEPRR